MCFFTFGKHVRDVFCGRCLLFFSKSFVWVCWSVHPILYQQTWASRRLVWSHTGVHIPLRSSPTFMKLLTVHWHWAPTLRAVINVGLSRWYASVDFKIKVALFMFCICPVRKLISFVVATVLVNMEVWKAPILLHYSHLNLIWSALEKTTMCHF